MIQKYKFTFFTTSTFSDIQETQTSCIKKHFPEIKNTSHYEYDMEWGSSGKSVGLIWKPNTEPYYDFMWILKDRY